jgi:hypothetical protein
MNQKAHTLDVKASSDLSLAALAIAVIASISGPFETSITGWFICLPLSNLVLARKFAGQYVRNITGCTRENLASVSVSASVSGIKRFIFVHKMKKNILSLGACTSSKQWHGYLLHDHTLQTPNETAPMSIMMSMMMIRMSGSMITMMMIMAMTTSRK